MQLSYKAFYIPGHMEHQLLLQVFKTRLIQLDAVRARRSLSNATARGSQAWQRENMKISTKNKISPLKVKAIEKSKEKSKIVFHMIFLSLSARSMQ